MNDNARLAALASYDILDTPPERDFDDVAELASEICGTPIAVVNLIDAERQFFKAEVGLGVRSTPLESSFCAKAILEEDFLVVPDATKDPRFDCNPLVTGEPGLRFYAGALLKTDEGYAIGTVCVLDFQARTLSALQEKTLRVLARQVMKQLELRKSLKARDEARASDHRRERRLDLLAQASAALLEADDPAATLRPVLEQGATEMGFEQSRTYDVLPDGRHLAMTHSVGIGGVARKALERVPFDVPLCGFVAESGAELVLTHVGATDEPRYAVGRDAGIRAFAGFPVTTGGTVTGVISFASTVEPVFDGEALAFFETVARFLSIANERAASVRRLAESEARSRLAQRAGRIGTFEVEVATGAMRVSPEFCQLFGVPVSETMPASDPEALIVPEDRGVQSDDISRKDGSAELDVEYRIRRADDGRLRWLARRAEFVRDGPGQVVRMIGTVHDITQRKTLQVHQAALLELGDRLREAANAADVVGAAAEILGRTLDATRAGYSRIDMRADLFEVQRDWTAPGATSLNGRYGLSMFNSTIGRLRLGETIAVANVGAAPWLANDIHSYEAVGTRAQIKVPLVDKGDLVGLLYAHQAVPRTWTKDEIDFAHGVADRAYAALGKVQAEADQAVLNQELSHRLKNTLSMVQAIAVQTLKGVTEKDAVVAFTRRIHALANAHDVLLQQSWSSARIGTVVSGVLGTFDLGDRFAVSGADVSLGPRATLSLSMLLHELATNALKYGALSAASGRVSVAWRVAGSDGDAELVLDWIESGGPPLLKPERKGFGSRLIGMGLIGTGGSELRYLPQGFEAEFKAPLSQVQQS